MVATECSSYNVQVISLSKKAKYPYYEKKSNSTVAKNMSKNVVFTVECPNCKQSQEFPLQEQHACNHVLSVAQSEISITNQIKYLYFRNFAKMQHDGS